MRQPVRVDKGAIQRAASCPGDTGRSTRDKEGALSIEIRRPPVMAVGGGTVRSSQVRVEIPHPNEVRRTTEVVREPGPSLIPSVSGVTGSQVTISD